jgi:hypothetical protein
MRIALISALAVLTGCSTVKDWFKAEEEPKKVVVTQSADPGAMSKLGDKIDKSDSRVAAALTAAIENKDKPDVVQAEGSLALAYLPKPTDGDLAFARARAAKADPKDYLEQSKFAKEFLASLDKEWKDAQDKAKKNADDLTAAMTKINDLNVELAKVRKDAEINLRKAEAEASKNVWTLAGVALVALGAILTAFMGVRVGGVLLVCGAFCGSMPFIYGSQYFNWVAGGTLGVAAALGLWRLYDYIKDKNDERGEQP